MEKIVVLFVNVFVTNLLCRYTHHVNRDRVRERESLYGTRIVLKF